MLKGRAVFQETGEKPSPGDGNCFFYEENFGAKLRSRMRSTKFRSVYVIMSPLTPLVKKAALYGIHCPELTLKNIAAARKEHKNLSTCVVCSFPVSG